MSVQISACSSGALLDYLIHKPVASAATKTSRCECPQYCARTGGRCVSRPVCGQRRPRMRPPPCRRHRLTDSRSGFPPTLIDWPAAAAAAEQRSNSRVCAHARPLGGVSPSARPHRHTSVSPDRSTRGRRRDVCQATQLPSPSSSSPSSYSSSSAPPRLEHHV
ncbi:unnamed protein product [Schistocephalus solidus]|uniref:Uncharacterized protein n=1 Tax=Schistocephalus solidus TaxID=70667 RepID=A0A183SR19_SCHSO|nr:unnamed protein product [Schistocephalus solidus]